MIFSHIITLVMIVNLIIYLANTVFQSLFYIQDEFCHFEKMYSWLTGSLFKIKDKSYYFEEMYTSLTYSP